MIEGCEERARECLNCVRQAWMTCLASLGTLGATWDALWINSGILALADV